jgi:hypothetical protein
VGGGPHADRAKEYEEVGRLLLDAGSPVDWQLPTDEPAEGVTEVLVEWQRRRAEAVR